MVLFSTLDFTPDEGRKFLRGLPDNFDASQWPRCAQCDTPMSHLLQTDELTPDLKLDGQLLSVFMCQNEDTMGECETWECGGECSAVIIRSLDHPTMTETPPDVVAEPRKDFTLTSADNGLDAATHAKFLGSEYWDLPEDVRFRDPDDPSQTFLGGTPTWLQGSEEGPGEPFRFGGMFAEDPWDGAANFGTGFAYLFVNLGTEAPEGRFFLAVLSDSNWGRVRPTGPQIAKLGGA